MFNKELVNNIELEANLTRLWTNGEYVEYDKTCTLNNINIKAYYNKDGIANIISTGEVSKYFRILMDTSNGDFIKVYINNNKLIKFNKCGVDIYYHNTKEENKIKDIKRVTFISTVRNNKNCLSKKS